MFYTPSNLHDARLSIIPFKMKAQLATSGPRSGSVCFACVAELRMLVQFLSSELTHI